MTFGQKSPNLNSRPVYCSRLYGIYYLFVFHILGGMGGCEYKAERMEALADLIKSRSPYFDLFLLAELWMQADHQLLEDAAKSVGLHMTGFRQLASG